MDSYFSERKKPLRLCGLPVTLTAIQKHFINDIIWPDFSNKKVVESEKMALEYDPIELREVYPLDQDSTVEVFPTDHTVERFGYMINRGKSSVLITADTYNLQPMIDLTMKSDVITALASSALFLPVCTPC
ncbi:MAG: hypothetical protein WBF77_10540 [Sulfurimonadaceae bacterium]